MADHAFFAEPKKDGGGGYNVAVPQAAAFSTAGAGDVEEIIEDEDLPF